ncbi:MAG: hypothetical protein WA639_15985, partial [Candidatus Acidiferrum sp.]
SPPPDRPSTGPALAAENPSGYRQAPAVAPRRRGSPYPSLPLLLMGRDGQTLPAYGNGNFRLQLRLHRL